MAELHELTLTGLTAALEAGLVSSTEATRHALDRITRLDGRDGLNAIIAVLAETALADAAASDARRAAGARRGPLDGVPLAVKDLFDLAGTPTTAGSPVLAGFVPATDATVVRRLCEAGAVLLAKTNLMEFAYGHPHPAFGETVNPWDRTRTAGGSSGGSAAAVAAGLAWGALGSDTGGSIRSPAAYCGVSGLKPTYGLVSLTGAVPLSWSLDHAGPLARTAEDCALLLAAIAGHARPDEGGDPGDPNSAPAEAVAGVQAAIQGLLDPSDGRRFDLRGLRIGVVTSLFEHAVTPGLCVRVEAALPTFADLGAELTPLDLDPAIAAAIVPTISAIYPAEAAAFHHDQGWYPDRAADYGPILRDELAEAMRLPAYRYVQAQRERQRIAAAFAELYERVDLLAWPAQPLVAPPLGTTDAAVDGAGTGATTIEVEIGATGPANLTGEPGIAIPCGLCGGLPVGLHLQGPRFADALVLRAAMAYQSATGIPPLAPERPRG